MRQRNFAPLCGQFGQNGSHTLKKEEEEPYCFMLQKRQSAHFSLLKGSRGMEQLKEREEEHSNFPFLTEEWLPSSSSLQNQVSKVFNADREMPEQSFPLTMMTVLESLRR